MIPQIIHYCWFGKKPLPEFTVKCIDSWRHFCCDYEIREWNEHTFDVNSTPYTKEAYEAGKYAFVSDFVRLYALYHDGGIYMDTDVEVTKPLDIFLQHNAFTGFEDTSMLTTCIMGSEKGGKWIKDLMDLYQDKHFIKENGKFDQCPNVRLLTSYMEQNGLIPNNSYQSFENLVTVYPKDYFSPKSFSTGEIKLTESTHTIHHFSSTWLNKYDITIRRIFHIFIEKIFGYKFHEFLVKEIRHLKKHV